MSYCNRCSGILLTDTPTELLNGKEYHTWCADKEKIKPLFIRRQIPTTKEHRENQLPPTQATRSILPGK